MNSEYWSITCILANVILVSSSSHGKPVVPDHLCIISFPVASWLSNKSDIQTGIDIDYSGFFDRAGVSHDAPVAVFHEEAVSGGKFFVDHVTCFQGRIFFQNFGRKIDVLDSKNRKNEIFISFL